MGVNVMKQSIVAELSEKREKMEAVANAFKSSFYNEFGFEPLVFYEDLNEIKEHYRRRVANIIGMDEIIEICNRYVDINQFPNGIKNRSRKRELVLIRHLFMYFAYRLNFNTTTIGKKLGYDHATVIHAHKQISALLDTGNSECIKLHSLIYEEIREKTGLDRPF